MTMFTPPTNSSAEGLTDTPPPLTDADIEASGAATLGLSPSVKPRSMFRRGLEVFTENKMALISVGFLAFIILFCFVGPLFYVTNQVNTNLNDVLCTPSGAHLLGCNEVGYDELGRLMSGGQTSLEVGFAAAFVSVVIGALYGAISGFVGGIVDSIMMRLVDAGLSLPYITVLIILSVVFHPNTAIMIFLIASFYWLGVARLVRGETLSLRTREYVQAVKVAGGSGSRAVLRHVLPNAVGTIIVQATFAVADSILILIRTNHIKEEKTVKRSYWSNKKN